MEQIEGGEAHEVGSRWRQLHRMGKRDVETIETITPYDYRHQ